MKHQQLIEQLSLTQKAFLMSGASTWETVPYEALGIPAIFLADGPHGLRKQEGASDHLGLNASLKATCFPTAATVANSWDPELGAEIGRSLGAEARNNNVHVVLGPGLNIKRHPFCGRNFEYFSEDPYQAGKMAAAYTRGIQENGVVACPKHLAANSQETRRMTTDSIVDERTLREIYLTGFEIAVKEGQAKSVMTAYNRLNGVYANEDDWLLQEVLVKEWGFDGFVVSDWGGSNDHVMGVVAGSHLEMPTTGVNGAKELVDAVASGRLSESLLDQRVDELLSVVLATASNKERSQRTLEEHHEVAKKAARESIVLLKNQEVLPLKAKTTIGIIGDFAETPRYQGAGSSVVNPTQLDTTLEVIGAYDLDYRGFAKGYHRSFKEDQKLIDEAVTLAKQVDTVLLYVGLDEISESEGLDRTTLSLPDNQLALIKAISAVNSKVVAIISAGSVIDMAWDEEVQGILHGYLGGQAGPSAMLDVIVGQATPSGKLSETYPHDYRELPAARDYPSATNQTVYQEGPYIGYRYFETVQKAVKYPFGYGLSYTQFAYADLEISQTGISCLISNVGQYDGAEIVQLYVAKESELIYRPEKELKGFTKVFLKAGESQRIEIPFDDKTFRYYNVASQEWQVEPGEYQLLVGASVQDIRLSGSCQQKGQEVVLSYDVATIPHYFSGQVAQVTMAEFEILLGKEVRLLPFTKGQELFMNDSISQLVYAKSGAARVVYHILNGILKRSEKKGKPNLNILFIYNMTFTAVGKMTNGMANHEMMEAVVVMVNGRFWSGAGQLFGAFRRNRKLQKRGI
ncbi:glycoside hydrolase family 3 C-terminal domain-containing protein [Vagococcus sp. BWB3-3]|uniref:Glycoside hydrolase family 3 C-terminal domain-containing protein n=1 Tax=Vagococcus allomyrinae TaxID=2794353 RepID=A0A940SX79_9ENTE|nr:glycoside hydrolase family 3 C-terminal domain-containing protein [Vagococcus allomyrinae]MBP1042103.1 glycoside hydrolase family 3 C-terminal domain-containing protein [Vagococcus allomyrinae]